MKTVVTIFGLILGFIAPRVQAADAPPKPGPEIKKLEIFTGKWKLDEVDEASPFSLAGKATFSSESRFVHNGFFVEEQGKGQLNGKPMSYTLVYSFDPSAHVYRTFYYDGTGAVLSSEGTFEGNTWKSHWHQKVDGKSYQGKSQAVLANDGKKFTYEWSYSEDGVTWKPMYKGTATKVGDVSKD